MTKQEAAQAYLRRDPVLYANLLEALRRGERRAAGGRGGGRPPLRAGMRAYMMSAASPAVAGRLLGMVPADCDLSWAMSWRILSRQRPGGASH